MRPGPPAGGVHPQVTIICNDADYFLRHRKIIADRLVELGSDVHVLTGGRKLDPAGASWASRHIRIERFSFHPLHDTKLALLTLFEVIGRRLDSLYLITLKPAVVCGLAALVTQSLSGYPRRVVITLAGLGRLLAPGSPPSLSRRLTEWALRRMGRRRSFQFTFETAHDRNLCLDRRLVHPSRATVIDGAGVDPAFFHPRRGERPPGPLRVLFASRLLRAKGLHAFLAAAREFQGAEQAEFLVAGFADAGDPDAFTPQQLAKERCIHFLGSAADMPELLRSVDVVCLPTRYGEGIPRILIEAAAIGLASIASDLDGCRAIVEPGRTGFLVPAGDQDAATQGIVTAVRAYIADPVLLRCHGQAAHEKFLSGGYAQDAVVEQFMRLIIPENSQPPT